MHSSSTFGAWTNHKHTQIHKTHHGPDLGAATILSFILFSMISYEGYIQNVILSHGSQVGNLEILKIGTFATLEAHNFFFFKPSIEMRFKEKF